MVSCFRLLNSSTGMPLHPLALLTAVLPKTHLTLLSRMSDHTIVVIQFIWIFFYTVLLCVLSISSWSLQCLLDATIYVLYCTRIWAKCSLDISSLPEESSSLSPSVVFLYFYTLFIEEGLLVSPFYSLEICILSLFPLLFTSLPSLAICKASSDNHFAFFSPLGWFCLLPLVQYYNLCP